MNQKSEPEDLFPSHHLAEKTTDEPFIRVMALHALAYCERLFYLEEVEEIRKADANVYAGRRMHDGLDKGPDIYTLELSSESLGIRGKLDCVRRQSGQLMVYEHKKGKSQKGKEAWPSDRLQVLAYTLLLAEHTGEDIREARIRYHADNKTIPVSVVLGEAEAEVRDAVARAHALRSNLERPQVNVPEYHCRTCSLAPVCLPEEERFARKEKAKVQRLFPPNEDRRVIHVVEQGCSVRKDGEQVMIYFPDGTKKALPGLAVSALVLHGNVQISTQVIHFCAAHDVGVHWLSYGGHYVGGLAPGAGPVQRRNRQYQAFQNPLCMADLTARMARAKMENQHKYLLRATRTKENAERPPEMEEKFSVIRSEIQSLGRIQKEVEEYSNDPSILTPEKLTCLKDSIRGHEGMAGRLYFSSLPMLLNLEKNDLMYFQGRNRRPPRDPFNAALSFGYALLYKDCVAALLTVGLEPSLGFFHTPRSAAYPLALDLMELFRVILWDIPLIGSVNRKQWTKDDFDTTSEKVWLNVKGRRKAIQLYENRKQEKWKHPALDYSLSYSRTIELEARLLEKEWTGSPGGFAQLRLR
jgi:CRISP-associated protein Cas1